MKRLTLEATDENVLNSIKENTYNRNEDVKDFVETLDTIEGNMFISLDARWGDGKTFYVRQIEKTLEYLTKKIWKEEQQEETDELEPYFINTQINSVDLQKSYLPIYYNAWLYDNHDDPLMSLIFTIIRKAEKYFDTKLSKTIGEKVTTLLSAASTSVTVKSIFQLSLNGDKVNEAIKSKDILENIKTSEEIREIVKEILNDVIVEKADRLVIFIDELDRCRPSYAIEMLERIKHYFDDERIIFIVSINKEQLVHTISKYYGYGFDSTGYLNKFFDLNTHMPIMYRNNPVFDKYDDRQFHLAKISDALNDHYKLTLRDSLIYKQRVSSLSVDYVNDNSPQGCCLSLFVPIIAILDIVDEDEKIKFMNGSSILLESLAKNIEAINKMVCRFGGYGEENAFEIGYKRIKEVYDYTFADKGKYAYNELQLRVGYDIKSICIKLCNGFI